MVVEAAAWRVGSHNGNGAVFHVRKIVLVGSRIVPHFDVGVSLSHQPRPKPRRHFAYSAGPQRIQPHAVELMLAWRAPDAHFHTDGGSKDNTDYRMTVRLKPDTTGSQSA